MELEEEEGEVRSPNKDSSSEKFDRQEAHVEDLAGINLCVELNENGRESELNHDRLRSIIVAKDNGTEDPRDHHRRLSKCNKAHQAVPKPYKIRGDIPRQVKKVIWNLEEEITKVIDKGVALGLDWRSGNKKVSRGTGEVED